LTPVTISDELLLKVINRGGGGVLADARILLVEDDDLNRRLVRTVLARSDNPVLRRARVVQAASLAEARTALASSAVDVVLLDMNLPDGHGLSLAAEVRSSGPGGPVMVALSGGGPEQGNAALAAGCTAVLGKPYRAAQLCALVCAALAN
jgi:two-component system KDP operon response regulator KdpE